MKKQANKNFILSLTLVAMLLLVVVIGNFILNIVGSEENRRVLYLLFGLGFFIEVFAWVCLLLIPFTMAVYIFVFALIARLIYAETPGRIKAYRILMGFSFAGQIVMLLFALWLITSGGVGSVIGLIVSAYIVWAIFVGMRGTYTDRIKVNGVSNESKCVE